MLRVVDAPPRLSLALYPPRRPTIVLLDLCLLPRAGCPVLVELLLPLQLLPVPRLLLSPLLLVPSLLLLQLLQPPPLLGCPHEETVSSGAVGRLRSIVSWWVLGRWEHGWVGWVGWIGCVGGRGQSVSTTHLIVPLRVSAAVELLLTTSATGAAVGALGLDLGLGLGLARLTRTCRARSRARVIPLGYPGEYVVIVRRPRVSGLEGKPAIG